MRGVMILGVLVGCVGAEPAPDRERDEPFLLEVPDAGPVPSPFPAAVVCSALLVEDGAARLVDIDLAGGIEVLADASAVDPAGVRSLAHLGDEVIVCDGARFARFDLATGDVTLDEEPCTEVADRDGNVLVGGEVTQLGRAVSEYPSWDVRDRVAPDPTPLRTTGDGALGRGTGGLLSANVEGSALFEEVGPIAVRRYAPSGLGGDVLGVSGADGRIFAVGSERPGVIVEQATPEALSADHVVTEGELRGLSCRVVP